MQKLDKAAKEYIIKHGLTSMFEVIFKAGAEWQASQEWVSVNDKTPEDEAQPYLCSNGSIYLPFVGIWSRTNQKFWLDGEYVTVKYWKYITPIPKEK